MKYIKPHPIRENNEFRGDIDILNDVKDIFNVFEDEFGFDMTCHFVKFDKNQVGKRYKGIIYNLDGNKLHEFELGGGFIPALYGKEWSVVGTKKNPDKLDIPKIYEAFKNSLNMVRSITGLESFINQNIDSSGRLTINRIPNSTFVDINDENIPGIMDWDHHSSISMILKFYNPEDRI